MRTFKKFRSTPYQSKVVRDNIKDVEWDCRFDINDDFTVDSLLANVSRELHDMDYILVSGVEAPGSNKYDSKGNHVHIAVIFITPRKRQEVLQLFRGPRKHADEYCTPRKRQWTYAGWVIHHLKSKEKLEGQPSKLFEKGTLPLDPFNEKTALEVKRRLKSFGTDETKERFKLYLDWLPMEDQLAESTD